MSVDEVISGTAPMPFLNKTAWLSAQHDSSALRRVYVHLTQGTRPSRKARHIRDVKRYLTICSLNDYGLVIVRERIRDMKFWKNGKIAANKGYVKKVNGC